MRVFAIFKDLLDEDQTEAMYELCDFIGENYNSYSYLEDTGRYFAGIFDYEDEESIMNKITNLDINTEDIALI